MPRGKPGPLPSQTQKVGGLCSVAGLGMLTVLAGVIAVIVNLVA